MRKLLIVSIFLIVFIAVIDIKPVYANNAGLSDLIKGATRFLYEGHTEEGEEKIYELDQDNLKETSNIIVNTLIALGTAVAVIWATILGIKYMMGSIEEKAEIKESIVPFIIGCVVLFGAFTIWKIVVNIGNSL